MTTSRALGTIEHMFDALLRAREAMATAATAFDPALLTTAECQQAMEHAAAIERMGAHLKALAAARVAESELWRQRGARSPEEDLAQRTGTSVTRAKEILDTGRRARSQPALDDAARRGELSPEQAAAISDAAHADPAAEERLVEGAGRQSLKDLRDTCGRVKAAATDPEERHRRLHRERRARTYTDAEGGWNLHLRTTPDVGAAVMERLRPVHDRIFRRARAAGCHEPAEAYAADALVDVILGSEVSARDDAAPPEAKAVRVASRAAKVIVRIDFDSLIRGFPVGDEVCEITGIGPVPVSVVEAMLATGDAFLAAVVTRGVDVVGVAHLGRQATDHQVTALQWLDPECPAELCSQTRWLEIDHREDWARTRITLLDWLDRPCRHHHDLKTRHGWAFVDGVGKRPMVPPDDPRHPANVRRRSADPPARGQPARQPARAA